MRNISVALLLIIILLVTGCFSSQRQESFENIPSLPRLEVNESRFDELRSPDDLSIVYPKGWSIKKHSTDRESIFTRILPESKAVIMMGFFRVSPPSSLGAALARDSEWTTEEMPDTGMWLTYTTKVRSSGSSYAFWGMSTNEWLYLYSFDIDGEPTEKEVEQTLALLREVVSEFVRVNRLKSSR